MLQRLKFKSPEFKKNRTPLQLRNNVNVIAIIVFLLSFVFVSLIVPQPEEESIQVTWFGVDLELVIQEVTDQTNIRILYDPQSLQNKQVYLISKDKIPVKALFKVLESICESFGLSIINMGPEDVPIYKIVKTEVVQKKPTPLYDEKDIEKERLGEKLITQITSLKHINAQDILPIVQGMVSNSAGVVAIPDTKIIVITDYALNVKKISKIIRLLDRPKPKIDIRVVKAKYAPVEELEAKLTSIIEEPGLIKKETETGPKSIKFKVIADKRTNSFIITGTKSQIKKIEQVIKKLDIMVPHDDKVYRFVKLKNQDAKKVADYLGAIIKANPEIVRDTQQPASSTQTQPTTQTQDSAKKDIKTYSSEKAEGEISVIPIEETNSVLIVGKDKIVAQLEKIVAFIDVRRPQVYLEAVVVEITATDDFDLGAEIASTHLPDSGTTYFGGTLFGISQLRDNDNDGLPDVKIPTGSSLGGGIIGLVKGGKGKIPFLLSLLSKKVNVNVVSKPQATTNDNAKASLTITDEFPTTTVQTTTINPITSFGGFQKAESILEVTPRISEGSHLILDIKLKIERFIGQQINASIPPPKTGREIKTILTAPNEFTVILGGIVVNSTDITVTGVPGLMSIPLLGNLFKRNQKKRVNTTLYIFLTPTILGQESFEDYKNITCAKYKEIEKELKDKWKIPCRIQDEGTAEGLNFFHYHSPFDKKN